MTTIDFAKKSSTDQTVQSAAVTTVVEPIESRRRASASFNDHRTSAEQISNEICVEEDDNKYDQIDPYIDSQQAGKVPWANDYAFALSVFFDELGDPNPSCNVLLTERYNNSNQVPADQDATTDQVQILRTLPDGDCLYRAITRANRLQENEGTAEQVDAYRNNEHRELRTQMADYLHAQAKKATTVNEQLYNLLSLEAVAGEPQLPAAIVNNNDKKKGAFSSLLTEVQKQMKKKKEELPGGKWGGNRDGMKEMSLMSHSGVQKLLSERNFDPDTNSKHRLALYKALLTAYADYVQTKRVWRGHLGDLSLLAAATYLNRPIVVLQEVGPTRHQTVSTRANVYYPGDAGMPVAQDADDNLGEPIYISYTAEKRHFNVVVPGSHHFQYQNGARTIVAPPHETAVAPLTMPMSAPASAPTQLGPLTLSKDEQTSFLQTGVDKNNLDAFCTQYGSIKFVEMKGRDRLAGMLIVSTPLDYLRDMDSAKVPDDGKGPSEDTTQARTAEEDGSGKGGQKSGSMKSGHHEKDLQAPVATHIELTDLNAKRSASEVDHGGALSLATEDQNEPAVELAISIKSVELTNVNAKHSASEENHGGALSLATEDQNEPAVKAAIPVKSPPPGQVTVAERYKIVQVNNENGEPRYYIEGEKRRLISLADFEAALRNNSLIDTNNDPVLYKEDDKAKQDAFMLAENEETKLLWQAKELEDQASDSLIDVDDEEQKYDTYNSGQVVGKKQLNEARSFIDERKKRSECDANRLRNNKGALVDPDNAGTPIRTLLLKLSRQSEFYLERNAALGGRPDRAGAVRRVDGLAPVIPAKAKYHPPKYEYYTFPIPHFKNASNGFSMVNMLLDGRKDNLCLFIPETGTHADDLEEKQTGYNDENKRAATVQRGPLLCELKGIAEVNVVQGAPGMQGSKARQFLDWYKNCKHRDTKDDIVLFIRTKDGAQHLLTMGQDSIRLELLSPRADKAPGAAVNKESGDYNPSTFANINVYSYDGNYIGHKSTDSGYPEPMLGTSTSATVEAGPALTPSTGWFTAVRHGFVGWAMNDTNLFGQGSYATMLNRLMSFGKSSLVSTGADWMANQISKEWGYVAGAQGVGAQDITGGASLNYAGAKEFVRMLEEGGLALVGKIIPKYYDLQRDPPFSKTLLKFAFTLTKEFTRNLLHEYLLLKANQLTINTRKSDIDQQLRNGLLIGVTASAIQRTIKELGLQPTDYRARAAVDILTHVAVDIGRALANAGDWDTDEQADQRELSPTSSPTPLYNATQVPYSTSPYNDPSTTESFFTTDVERQNVTGNMTGSDLMNGWPETPQIRTTSDFFTSYPGSGYDTADSLTPNGTVPDGKGTTDENRSTLEVAAQIFVSSVVKNTPTKYVPEIAQWVFAERHIHDRGTAAFDSQMLLFGNHSYTFTTVNLLDTERWFENADSEKFWLGYMWRNSWFGQEVNNLIRTARVRLENCIINCGPIGDSEEIAEKWVLLTQEKIDDRLIDYQKAADNAANDSPLRDELEPDQVLASSSVRAIRSKRAPSLDKWLEREVECAYVSMSGQRMPTPALRFDVTMIPPSIRRKADSYHDHQALDAKFDVVRGPNGQWITQSHLANKRGHVNEERIARAQEAAARSSHHILVKMQDRKRTRAYIYDFAQDRNLGANCQRAITTFMNRKSLVQIGMRIPEMGASALTPVCHGIKFRYLKYSLNESSTSNPEHQREFGDQLYINVAARACPSIPTLAFYARGVKYEFEPSEPDKSGKRDAHTTMDGGHAVRKPDDHNATERKIKTGDVVVNSPTDQYTVSLQAAAIQGYESTFGNLSMKQTQFMAIQCETAINWADWRTEHNATVAMMPYAVFTTQVIWDGPQVAPVVAPVVEQDIPLPSPPGPGDDDSEHSFIENHEDMIHPQISPPPPLSLFGYASKSSANDEDAADGGDDNAEIQGVSQPPTLPDRKGYASGSGSDANSGDESSSSSSQQNYAPPRELQRVRSLSKLKVQETLSQTHRTHPESKIYGSQNSPENVGGQLLGQTVILKQVDTYSAQVNGFRELTELKGGMPLFIDPASGELRHIEDPNNAYGVKDMGTAKPYKDAADGFSTIVHGCLAASAAGRTSMEASIHAMILREDDLTVKHYRIKVRQDSPDFALAQPKSTPTRMQHMLAGFKPRDHEAPTGGDDDDTTVSSTGGGNWTLLGDPKNASDNDGSDSDALGTVNGIGSHKPQRSQEFDADYTLLHIKSDEQVSEPVRRQKDLEHIKISGLDLALESPHHHEFRARHWTKVHQAVTSLVRQIWTDSDNDIHRRKSAQSRRVIDNTPDSGNIPEPDADAALALLTSLDPRYPRIIAQQAVNFSRYPLKNTNQDGIKDKIRHDITFVRDAFTKAVGADQQMSNTVRKAKLEQAREAFVQDIFDHLVATSPSEQIEQVRKSFREEGARRANAEIRDWQLNTSLVRNEFEPASDNSDKAELLSVSGAKAGQVLPDKEWSSVNYDGDQDVSATYEESAFEQNVEFDHNSFAELVRDDSTDSNIRLAVRSLSWVLGRPIILLDYDTKTGQIAKNEELSCLKNEFGGSFLSHAKEDPICIGRDEAGNFLAMRQSGDKGVGNYFCAYPADGQCDTVGALLHAVYAGINPDAYVVQDTGDTEQRTLEPKSNDANKTTTSLLETVKRFCQVDCAYIKDSLTKAWLGDEDAEKKLTDRQRQMLLDIDCEAPVIRDLQRKLDRLMAMAEKIDETFGQPEKEAFGQPEKDASDDENILTIDQSSILRRLDMDLFGKYGANTSMKAGVIDPNCLLTVRNGLEQQLKKLEAPAKKQSEHSVNLSELIHSGAGKSEENTNTIDVEIEEEKEYVLKLHNDLSEMSVSRQDTSAASAKASDEQAAQIKQRLTMLAQYVTLYNECATIARDLRQAKERADLQKLPILSPPLEHSSSMKNEVEVEDDVQDVVIQVDANSDMDFNGALGGVPSGDHYTIIEESESSGTSSEAP